MSENNKLRVVMVEPGKPAYETEIENTLDSQEEVENVMSAGIMFFG